MNDSFILGVDIGGSHITAALIDLGKNTILLDSLVRQNVNSRQSAEEIIKVWSDTIKKVASFYKVSNLRLGIAMPGPVDYKNGICQIKNQDKYDALYGLNLKVLLAEKLGIAPSNIKMINDAGAFLQGEVFAGAGIGYHHVIGITLGTGLGTSRYHGTEATDAALWCMPFLNSMAEDYLSTRWIVKRYLELTGMTLNDAKSLADLVDNDENAKKVFEEFGHNLGLFLLEFILMDKPEVIILGGNIAKAKNLFLPQIQKILANDRNDIRINLAYLGEEAALIGAASCWYKEIFNISLVNK